MAIRSSIRSFGINPISPPHSLSAVVLVPQTSDTTQPPLKQTKLDDFQTVGHDKMNQNAMKLFARFNIPFRAIESSELSDLLLSAIKYGKHWQPPSTTTVRTVTLNETVFDTTDRLIPIMQRFSTTKCTMICDGWKNVNDQTIVNVLLFSADGDVFREAKEFRRETQRRGYCSLSLGSHSRIRSRQNCSNCDR
ncbi:hypothetical protein GEMRC1_012449 [Eukaryota sp. GEM-RC1]